MALADFALPAAIVGGFFLIRELKEFDPTFGLGDFLTDIIPEGDIIIQPKGVDELLEERTEALQQYEQERTTDYQRIEAERAIVQLEAGNYGTVPGPLGAFTGTWSRVPGKPGDSCSVLYGTGAASNTTRYFTGNYCRGAAAMGLIDPFTG